MTTIDGSLHYAVLTLNILLVITKQAFRNLIKKYDVGQLLQDHSSYWRTYEHDHRFTELREKTSKPTVTVANTLMASLLARW